MEEVKRYTIDFSDGETAEGVLYTDYAALEARVAELEWANGYASKVVGKLRAQLEAANERHFQAVYAVGEEIEKNEALQAQLTAQPDGARAVKALSVIADYPETWCRGCNWAGPDDYVIKQGVDMCPHCQSEKLEDFCAGEYATQALAAPAPRRTHE